ncbi:Metallo-dependent phosphatase [Wolfiporia cocos MD-104 SS10]|uniref:Metallo-dependent phosphatase n=1 Tax=Wolfiporia cocos (strain MD-104) TaxID=742152 RepID=A0A2H3J6E7_WOLCO|nr:Metallo-dependent phosphatase [Wolfiporia cocos MD-104 SS10]
MPATDSAIMSTATSAVYVTYDVDNPPPHPGPSWTRFVCISDTHSHIYSVPPGDVLLHSGDLSNGGYLDRLRVTVEWLRSLPHPIKIFIAGNHDTVARAQDLVRNDASRSAGMCYLEHDSVVITAPSGREWEVYGSPASPRHSCGAFQYEYDEGAELYKIIPPTIDVLLTHTPPFDICDRTRKGKRAGCRDLADRLKSEDLQRCRLHVFGHIHESHGAQLIGNGDRARVSVNAALAYGGQAVIVDLKD